MRAQTTSKPSAKEEPVLCVKRFNKNAQMPEYKTKGAAGFDLYVLDDKRITVSNVWLIPTGLGFEIPEGYQLEIRLRSSAAKLGLIIPNAPCTIDSDYRGEVSIPLASLHNNVVIRKGERIAQAVLMPAPQATLKEVEELGETERGMGGFGSTG